MNLTEKTSLVQGFSDRISEVPLVVLADYRGVSVAEITEFRDKLRKAGFYAEWKGRYGEEGWSLLEKACGKLT